MQPFKKHSVPHKMTPPGSMLTIIKNDKTETVITTSQEETADILEDAKQQNYKVAKCEPVVDDKDKDRPEYVKLPHIP